MQHQIFHYSIAVIFVLFALVQLNDSDAVMWVPPYLLVAYLAFRAGSHNYYMLGSAILLIFFIVWMSMYQPHMRDWVADGMPSITESMKAESPYIELSREFFGLLLCALTTTYYLIIAKRNR